MSVNPAWIAVDWGTSNLRVWAMGSDDQPLAEAQSDQGMNQLAPKDFPRVLGALIKDWDVGDAPIIGCGMVGSRQGWAEAPYRAVPCPPLSGEELTRASGEGASMLIVPGLCQTAPADVMRGEETQIAGFLEQNPSFDGLLCLPGTHTKWVRLASGAVQWFRTFMSGEMFQLIATQSVLRHSMDQDLWDDAVFEAAVNSVTAGEASLCGALFEIRASGLVAGAETRLGRPHLSGLIVGEEIAAIAPELKGQAVTIIGSGEMASAYALGLKTLGVTTTTAAVTPLTLAGLARARRSLHS